MEGCKDFASLPREMVLKIFDLLSIEELKICVQVDTLSACKGLGLSLCYRCLELGGTLEAAHHFGRTLCTSFSPLKQPTLYLVNLL